MERGTNKIQEITGELNPRGKDALSRSAFLHPGSPARCPRVTAKPGAVKPSSGGCRHTEHSLQRVRWQGMKKSFLSIPRGCCCSWGQPRLHFTAPVPLTRGVFHVLKGVLELCPATCPADVRETTPSVFSICARKGGGNLDLQLFLYPNLPLGHPKPRSGLEIGPVLISQTSSGSQVTSLSLGA